eukprot:TRINITY_DN7240_c0_g1_i3.p1 TRINITY_DN7240_c0_g1~~TRINITY_DN7240_c0_g1_i3.p1  ORF type:complete len:696 (+),score=159.74 TRINITY_DN7240_c0_g1_i3:24-2090(+)
MDESATDTENGSNKKRKTEDGAIEVTSSITQNSPGEQASNHGNETIANASNSEPPTQTNVETSVPATTNKANHTTNPATTTDASTPPPVQPPPKEPNAPGPAAPAPVNHDAVLSSQPQSTGSSHPNTQGSTASTPSPSTLASPSPMITDTNSITPVLAETAPSTTVVTSPIPSATPLSPTPRASTPLSPPTPSVLASPSLRRSSKRGASAGMASPTSNDPLPTSPRASLRTSSPRTSSNNLVPNLITSHPLALYCHVCDRTVQSSVGELQSSCGAKMILPGPLGPLIYRDKGYDFVCSQCGNGKVTFKHTNKTWLQLSSAAYFNLFLQEGGDKTKYHSLDTAVAFIESHIAPLLIHETYLPHIRRSITAAITRGGKAIFEGMALASSSYRIKESVLFPKMEIETSPMMWDDLPAASIPAPSGTGTMMSPNSQAKRAKRPGRWTDDFEFDDDTGAGQISTPTTGMRGRPRVHHPTEPVLIPLPAAIDPLSLYTGSLILLKWAEDALPCGFVTCPAPDTTHFAKLREMIVEDEVLLLRDPAPPGVPHAAGAFQFLHRGIPMTVRQESKMLVCEGLVDVDFEGTPCPGLVIRRPQVKESPQPRKARASPAKSPATSTPSSTTPPRPALTTPSLPAPTPTQAPQIDTTSVVPTEEFPVQPPAPQKQEQPLPSVQPQEPPPVQPQETPPVPTL